MTQPTSALASLGILSLLLVTAGLLLTYFDWSAARRREFLYIYFDQDKPGMGYFAAARRRRAQYTRLLVAFLFLFIAEFLTTNLFLKSLTTDPALRVQDSLYLETWVHCWWMLGLALLGLGLLYNPDSHRKPNIDTLFYGFLSCWTLFIFGLTFGVWGANAHNLVTSVSVVTQTVMSIGFALAAFKRDEEHIAPGLLRASPAALALAFILWGIGPFAGGFFDGRSLHTIQFCSVLSFAVLVPVIARGVLTEYENVEGSRHRLGRERQVIFTFLQRIGAAFTTAVEVEKVLKIILESGLETTEASAGAIFLFNAEARTLTPRVVLNFFPPLYVDTPAAHSDRRTEELEAEMVAQEFALGEGVVGLVAQEGKARIIADVRAEGIMLGTTTEFMRNRSMLLVPLKIRDEPLGVMAVLNKQRGSFTMEDQFLLQALADQGALSINNAMLTLEVGKQERIRRELQIARDIQRMLLPEQCPVLPGYELAARGSSATEVGGDYYDFFQVDDNHLGIVVADVSGKGVPAALTVAMMRSVFRTQAQNNCDVRDVLARVNSFMTQDMRRDMFITCIYGILDVRAQAFTFARAGHEPLLLSHDHRDTQVLRPNGFALGVIDSPDFDELLEVETVQLESGDRLFFFTDGLTEAMNTNGDEFGMNRILAILNRTDPIFAEVEKRVLAGAKAGVRSDGTPEEILHDVVDVASGAIRSHAPGCAPDLSTEDPDDLKWMELAVRGHVKGAPQSDDLTIVYLEVK